MTTRTGIHFRQIRTRFFLHRVETTFFNSCFTKFIKVQTERFATKLTEIYKKWPIILQEDNTANTNGGKDEQT